MTATTLKIPDTNSIEYYTILTLSLETRPYCFGLPERSIVNQEKIPGFWCDGCDHFTECQAANENKPAILVLNLKEKYFDEIAIGIKREEYREAVPYWFSRVEGKNFDVIELRRKYPKRGDLSSHMWFRYHGYRVEKMDWINGDKIMSCETIIFPIRDRLEYPYQVMEKGRRDIPASF